MGAAEGVELFVREFSLTRMPNAHMTVINLELILDDSQVVALPDLPMLLDGLFCPGAVVKVSRPAAKRLLKPAVTAGEAPAPCIPTGDAAGTW